MKAHWLLQHWSVNSQGVPSSRQAHTPFTQVLSQTAPHPPQFWASLVGSTQPAAPQTMPALSRQAPVLQKPEQHWSWFWQVCWFATQAGSSGGQAQDAGSLGCLPRHPGRQLPPHNSEPMGHELEGGSSLAVVCQPPMSPGWGPLKMPAAAPEQLAIGRSPVPENASFWFPPSVTTKSMARPAPRPTADWSPPVEGVNDT
jgi:hypothetical protein